MPGSRFRESSGIARSISGKVLPSREAMRQRVSANGRTLFTPGSAAIRSTRVSSTPSRSFVVDPAYGSWNFQDRFDESQLKAVDYAEHDNEGGDSDGDFGSSEKRRSRATALPPGGKPAMRNEAYPTMRLGSIPWSGQAIRRCRMHPLSCVHRYMSPLRKGCPCRTAARRGHSRIYSTSGAVHHPFEFLPSRSSRSPSRPRSAKSGLHRALSALLRDARNRRSDIRFSACGPLAGAQFEESDDRPGRRRGRLFYPSFFPLYERAKEVL